MSDSPHTAGPWPVAEIAALERREADLRAKLERCIPPVDQHRRELERVRADLAAARTRESGQAS